MPKQCEDYVHRIGRTARAGASGSAYALFTKNNMMIAGDLVKVNHKQIHINLNLVLNFYCV